MTENSEINVARVEGRVRQGGHDVDVGKIRSRYERSLHYLPRAVEMADHALVFDSTQERQMRLCFQKRRFVTARDLPTYLQVRLMNVLKQREEERVALRSGFGNLTLPNEEAGEYTGPLRFVAASYVVQETDLNRFVLHDCLLLPINVLASLGMSIDAPIGIYYSQGEGGFISS